MRALPGRLAVTSGFVLALVTALVALPGPATAQVAAPSLNPVLVLTTAPPNPAVLSWDTPSRVTVSLGRVEQDFVGVASDPDAEGSIRMAQASLVGDVFAVAIAGVDVSTDYNAPLAGSSSTEATVIFLAGRFGDSLTLGLGMESGSQSSTLFGLDSEEDIPTLGITYRFGDSVYLGAAGGTATVRDLSAAPTVESSRGISRYGLAYHARGPEQGLHVELFHEEKEGALATGTEAESSNGFTVEVVFSNILVGYVSNRQERNTAAGADAGNNDVDTVTVGYVPAPGLAIAASSLSFESFDAANVKTFTQTIQSVGVAWQF